MVGIPPYEDPSEGLIISRFEEVKNINDLTETALSIDESRKISFWKNYPEMPEAFDKIFQNHPKSSLLSRYGDNASSAFTAIRGWVEAGRSLHLLFLAHPDETTLSVNGEALKAFATYFPKASFADLTVVRYLDSLGRVKPNKEKAIEAIVQFEALLDLADHIVDFWRSRKSILIGICRELAKKGAIKNNGLSKGELPRLISRWYEWLYLESEGGNYSDPAQNDDLYLRLCNSDGTLITARFAIDAVYELQRTSSAILAKYMVGTESEECARKLKDFGDSQIPSYEIHNYLDTCKYLHKFDAMIEGVDEWLHSIGGVPFSDSMVRKSLENDIADMCDAKARLRNHHAPFNSMAKRLKAEWEYIQSDPKYKEKLRVDARRHKVDVGTIEDFKRGLEEGMGETPKRPEGSVSDGKVYISTTSPKIKPSPEDITEEERELAEGYQKLLGEHPDCNLKEIAGMMKRKVSPNKTKSTTVSNWLKRHGIKRNDGGKSVGATYDSKLVAETYAKEKTRGKGWQRSE